MGYYGWCPHNKDGDEYCHKCSKRNIEQKERIRKLHGPNCNCYVCDWDEYWRHLGKQ